MQKRCKPEAARKQLPDQWMEQSANHPVALCPCINYLLKDFKVMANLARLPSVPLALTARRSLEAGMGLPLATPSCRWSAPGCLIAEEIQFLLMGVFTPPRARCHVLTGFSFRSLIVLGGQDLDLAGLVGSQLFYQPIA